MLFEFTSTLMSLSVELLITTMIPLGLAILKRLRKSCFSSVDLFPWDQYMCPPPRLFTEEDSPAPVKSTI
jgi:hypothetical protein